MSRTLLNILNTIKLNKPGLSSAGRLNKAHDDFLSRINKAEVIEKKEALEFLKKEKEEGKEFEFDAKGISLHSLISYFE